MKKNFLMKILSLVMALMLLPALPALAQEAAAPAEGAQTPNYFEMVKTTDLDGNAFDLSQYKGRLLMVNIWAEWCPPCRGELPTLDKLAEEYKDKALIVGLLAEGAKVEDGKLVRDEEKAKAAKEILDELKITYPTLVADEILYTVMAQLGVNVLPTTWFVNEDGMIVKVVTGALDEQGWRDTIDELLKGAADAEKQ